MEPLLRGLRVLDLSRVLAGPWAGQALADLGAEVLKVERPGVGDDTRGWGPPFVGDPARGMSAYYLSCNRGKASIAVDLADAEGAARVRRLALAADVVIENFKPGALARHGLDAASLRAAKPSLIVCSITGFGQTGPCRDRAGYDLMIQAMGGLMSLTGDPDGPPMKTGVAVADLMTGMYAVSAILAAVVRRGRTGEGAHLDLALLDTQVAWLANQGLNTLVSGEAPARRGNAHPNLVPYEVVQAADGWFCLAVGSDGQFAAFAGLAGRSEWATDERFRTNAARVRHREALMPLVAGVVRARERAWWIGACEGAGIPCGPILAVDEALVHEQIAARGGVGRLGPDGLPTLAGPIVVDGVRASSEVAPPELDEGRGIEGRWLAGG